MKRIVTFMLCGVLCVGTMCGLTGCMREADKVSHNLSLEADNFNVVRRLTVMDCITGDTLFTMTGNMSIEEQTGEHAPHQLQIIVEEAEGQYAKHIVGLSDNVSYIVEDLHGEDVNQYRYTLNFNPNMWIPFNVDTID